MEDYHKIYNLQIATANLKLWKDLIIWVYCLQKRKTLKGNYNTGCKRDQSNEGSSEKMRIPQSFYIMSTWIIW